MNSESIRDLTASMTRSRRNRADIVTGAVETTREQVATVSWMTVVVCLGLGLTAWINIIIYNSTDVFDTGSCSLRTTFAAPTGTRTQANEQTQPSCTRISLDPDENLLWRGSLHFQLLQTKRAGIFSSKPIPSSHQIRFGYQWLLRSRFRGG